MWSFWQSQLSGTLPILSLPLDFPRPLKLSGNAGSFTLPLPAQLTSHIKVLAEGQGVNIFTLLLSAFEVFLFRYTSQDEVLIGSSLSTRTEPGLEGIVGPLCNRVVYRANLSGNPAFSRFVQRNRNQVCTALHHHFLFSVNCSPSSVLSSFCSSFPL